MVTQYVTKAMPATHSWQSPKSQTSILTIVPKEESHKVVSTNLANTFALAYQAIEGRPLDWLEPPCSFLVHNPIRWRLFINRWRNEFEGKAIRVMKGRGKRKVYGSLFWAVVGYIVAIAVVHTCIFRLSEDMAMSLWFVGMASLIFSAIQYMRHGSDTYYACMQYIKFESESIQVVDMSEVLRYHALDLQMQARKKKILRELLRGLPEMQEYLKEYGSVSFDYSRIDLDPERS